MQIKIFTMPYSGAIGGFDDEGVRGFLVDKEVLSVQPQFFVKDGVPHWTVLVQYNLMEGSQEASKPRERKTSFDEVDGVVAVEAEQRRHNSTVL